MQSRYFLVSNCKVTIPLIKQAINRWKAILSDPSFYFSFTQENISADYNSAEMGCPVRLRALQLCQLSCPTLCRGNVASPLETYISLYNINIKTQTKYNEYQYTTSLHAVSTSQIGHTTIFIPHQPHQAATWLPLHAIMNSWISTVLK